MKVEWIVIHTAAADRPGVTFEEIRRWHLDQGWSDIGYHWVIEDDGTLRAGRPENRQGAHAKGLNDRSIGVCVTGHGDVSDFNAGQYKTLLIYISHLLWLYDLTIDRVIGHREIERAGAPNPHKTCPGKMVDMDKLRAAVAREMARVAQPPLTVMGPARSVNPAVKGREL